MPSGKQVSFNIPSGGVLRGHSQRRRTRFPLSGPRPLWLLRRSRCSSRPSRQGSASADLAAWQVARAARGRGRGARRRF